MENLSGCSPKSHLVLKIWVFMDLEKADFSSDEEQWGGVGLEVAAQVENCHTQTKSAGEM